MLKKALIGTCVPTAAPREGDLYKEVNICGKSFRLRYGYYESFERATLHNDPMPIYPDLQKQPHYTPQGVRIVTAMQDVCTYYRGKSQVDTHCADCTHFEKSEELFGLCRCTHNQRTKVKGANAEYE